MNPIKIQILRGTEVESEHFVNAYIGDFKGNKIAEYYFSEDKDKKYFPRSAIKFIQALPLAQSGALTQFQLSDRHLALACASHEAEKFHTDLVESWLRQLHLDESVLECGAHEPGNKARWIQMIEQHQIFTQIHNNCSGKHVGLLTVCQHFGWSTKNYSNFEHPVQQLIRKTMLKLIPEDKNLENDLNQHWGIDGCGIPTYALTLKQMAEMLTWFLPQKTATKENHPESFEILQASKMIVAAIQKNPELVSGTQGFCTQIMKKTLGRVLVKTGAEGVYIAIDLKQGLVLALKARDGQTRASRAALVYLLKEFKMINESEISEIIPLGQPILKNWLGQTVGTTLAKCPEQTITVSC